MLVYPNFGRTGEQLYVHVPLLPMIWKYNNEFPELFFISADNSVTVVSFSFVSGSWMVIFETSLSFTSE